MGVKRAYQMLIVAPFLVRTEWQVADIFTKLVTKEVFYRMRAYLMNLPVGYSEEAGMGVRAMRRLRRFWKRHEP